MILKGSQEDIPAFDTKWNSEAAKNIKNACMFRFILL